LVVAPGGVVAQAAVQLPSPAIRGVSRGDAARVTVTRADGREDHVRPDRLGVALRVFERKDRDRCCRDDGGTEGHAPHATGGIHRHDAGCRAGPGDSSARHEIAGRVAQLGGEPQRVTGFHARGLRGDGDGRHAARELPVPGEREGVPALLCGAGERADRRVDRITADTPLIPAPRHAELDGGAGHLARDRARAGVVRRAGRSEAGSCLCDGARETRPGLGDCNRPPVAAADRVGLVGKRFPKDEGAAGISGRSGRSTAIATAGGEEENGRDQEYGTLALHAPQ